MDQGPLVKEQIDAGARFVQEFAKYTPVQAAFWLKATYDNTWFLYVVGDELKGAKVWEAHYQAALITSAMPTPWFGPIQIKVIATDHPIAKAVLEIQEKYPQILPFRLGDGRLGDETIEDAYIYRLPITVPG
ncbi:MAG TPA: hypothetical protein VEL76_31950 [Gemmataceae bacterium]|nr:hypothetical protein [Gemmataceae bacterium]